MHKDKYVFAQLASFLDRSKFNRLVAKYDGDKYVKSYTCWNQLLERTCCAAENMIYLAFIALMINKL